MGATRVLVVDDSLTMRALIAGMLERIPQVEVVGSAESAAEAREMVARLHPDVITLDVEMPETNGLAYLAEVMGTRPMPVIMFSGRTEPGSPTAVEALRLGAIDCFAKPRLASPAELAKIITSIGKCIKSAWMAELKPATPSADAPPLDWNGRLLAIGADAGNTNVLFDLLGSFPDSCPPTLIVQHLGGGAMEHMAAKLDEQVAPRVVLAKDGTPAEQGTIYFAPGGATHLAIDGWPAGRLRLRAEAPVAGERPSISVLFASVAEASGANAVGLLLARGSGDGDAGMQALLDADGYGFTPLAGRTPGFTLARKTIRQPVAPADLSRSLLRLFAK